MNNKLLKTYILLAFAAIISTTSVAQTRLQFGLEDHATLVKTPYIHWDLLRTMSPEWVRELRNTPTAPWEPLNRLFNEQDAGGRFTLLQYQVWSLANNDWVDDNKNTYMYTLNANNLVSEMQIDEMNPFFTNARTMTFEYNASGGITRVTSETNGNISFEGIWSYNSQGQRVVDSSFSFPGGNKVNNGLIYYDYDANNRCIKKTTVFRNNNHWDTLGYDFYTWQDSNLTGIESHSIEQLGGPVLPFSSIEYVYENGNITDATIYEYDSAAAQFYPILFYIHYYDYNRLTAMVSGDYTGTSRDNIDSIALTYLPNGNLDTGYQFAALSNGNWETAARFRLLFRKINTGITPVAPLVSAVNVYPNPVADQLSVDVEMVEGGNISLQVTDITGKLVKTINAVNLPAGKNTLEVSALDMAPGVYVVTCGESSVKIVKQ